VIDGAPAPCAARRGERLGKAEQVVAQAVARARPRYHVDRQGSRYSVTFRPARRSGADERARTLAAFTGRERPQGLEKRVVFRHARRFPVAARRLIRRGSKARRRAMRHGVEANGAPNDLRKLFQ